MSGYISKNAASKELGFADVSQLELLLENAGFDYKADPISVEVFELLKEEVDKAVKVMSSAALPGSSEPTNNHALTLSQPAELNAIHSQVDAGVLEVLELIAAEEGSAFGQHLAAVREQALRASMSASANDLIHSYLEESHQRLQKLGATRIDEILANHGIATASQTLGKAQAIAPKLEEFKAIAQRVRATFS